MSPNFAISDVISVLTGGQPLPPSVYSSAESPVRTAYWRLARAAGLYGIGDTPAIEVLRSELQRIRRWCTERTPDWAAEACAGDSVLNTVVGLVMQDQYRRAELEARVLADQPIAEIADRLCVTPSVVAAYEFFFWDVRQHLSADAWIRHHAIRWDHAFVLPRRAVPLLWRLLGYRYGVLALDWLTTSISHQTLRRDGVDAYLEPDVPIPVELKHAIAGRRLPIPKTPRELMLMELLRQLSELLAAQKRADLDLAGPLSQQTEEGQPLIIDDRVLALTRQYLREAA